MSDMKDKLRKATLLLLFPLLLSSTGCLTWQPVTGLPLPAKVAEQVLDHPSTTIRIVAPGVPRLQECANWQPPRQRHLDGAADQ